jgi:hypothetical protein
MQLRASGVRATRYRGTSANQRTDGLEGAAVHLDHGGASGVRALESPSDLRASPQPPQPAGSWRPGRCPDESDDEHDPVAQSLWRQVAALVAAHRGEHTKAERLAREALIYSQKTDSTRRLRLSGGALLGAGEVCASPALVV